MNSGHVGAMRTIRSPGSIPAARNRSRTRATSPSSRAHVRIRRSSPGGVRRAGSSGRAATHGRRIDGRESAVDCWTMMLLRIMRVRPGPGRPDGRASTPGIALRQ